MPSPQQKGMGELVPPFFILGTRGQVSVGDSSTSPHPSRLPSHVRRDATSNAPNESQALSQALRRGGTLWLHAVC